MHSSPQKIYTKNVMHSNVLYTYTFAITYIHYEMTPIKYFVMNGGS
jgi:hypothetical protein